MVFSSLVIHTQPQSASGVEQLINGFDQAEIVEKSESGFAVLLQTDSTDEAAGITSILTDSPGILSVQLVAHFFEEETE